MEVREALPIKIGYAEALMHALKRCNMYAEEGEDGYSQQFAIMGVTSREPILLFPEGWRLQRVYDDPTEVGYCFDAFGRRRVEIIRSPQDNKIRLEFLSRYGLWHGASDTDLVVQVRDAGQEIKKSFAVKPENETSEARIEAFHEALVQAHDWLFKHYPGWMDPMKYWDD